ncbi:MULTISPECIES: hypothetical protein [Arthrobacter]|nr:MULTISPECIES: hypothetical protein [Arthrobacter]MBT8162382.1 hypothetical protein [Arthrobacter sp. GN70]
MSASYSEETKDDAQDVTVRAVLEEEFKSVFGGTKPVAMPWAGLIYI